MTAINDGIQTYNRLTTTLGTYYSNVAVRRAVWQALAAFALFGGVFWLAHNLHHNLAARNISSGFGFLTHEAGLPIAEPLIAYTPADSYFRALLVGTLNTLWVAFWSIILATVLGTAIGIARISKNWLLARISSVYVEMFRNVPLLLQLFLWYTILQKMPSVRQALNPVGGFFLSNRGLSFPVLDWQAAHSWTLLAFAFSLLGTTLYVKSASRKRLEEGRSRMIWPVAVALLLVLPLTVALSLSASVSIDMPQPKGFNIRGGMTISPEFFALLVGLVVYNAAFIAEIVRSGLESVSRGQHEAAYALGLRPRNVLKWIVFPQALRVIVPPLTSQYLNLTKSSSLAVAIGYQDIVSIATTTMNQTGQSIELVGIIMAVYLTISLSISLLMNVYDARVALAER